MTKENVLSFLSHAAKDKKLKAELEQASSQEEITKIGQKAGYFFSKEHIDEALSDLKQKPGFFGALAGAIFELFRPDKDNYPATGVQPYSGDQNPSR